MRYWLSTALSYVKYLAMAFVLFGEQICGFLGIERPPWLDDVKEKKWILLMGLFFVGNMVTQQLLATGAFEIFVNDELVYSKLETGRMPENQDIQPLLRLIGV